MRSAAFLSLLLMGCVSPSTQFLNAALQYGFQNEIYQGKPYLHRIFSNLAVQQTTSQIDELHVYLDGDGSPFLNSNQPSDDPTSCQHLILDLLSQDTKPAILLGRPCYYALQKSSECKESLWTSARYSQEIINSLVFTLEQFLKTKPATRLVFIGYSGGGALAVFLAGHFSQTLAVVTIAGNLDVQSWTDFHHYSALQSSLNPIESAQIPSKIKQFHLAGGQDKNVSAKFIKHFSEKHPNSTFLLFDDFNHSCCWIDAWQDFLTSALK
jgi:hypothetical protein